MKKQFQTLKPHPLCKMFPPMGDDEYKSLLADMETNGQREPITTLDGMILDGQNRFKACKDLDMNPKTRKFRGPGTPTAFVIAMNVNRRHLDASQRAMIAAAIVTTEHGGDRKSDQEVNLPLDRVTLADAANALSVSESAVKHATIVHDDGVPELKDAVVSGDVAVSAASKIATLPTKSQVKAMRAIKSGASVSEITAKIPKPKPTRISAKKSSDGVPARLQDQASGEWVETSCDMLDALVKQIKSNVNKPWGPWLKPMAEIIQGLTFARNSIANLRFGKVCEKCEGKSGECRNCRSSGWLPQWRVEEMAVE